MSKEDFLAECERSNAMDELDEAAQAVAAEVMAEGLEKLQADPEADLSEEIAELKMCAVKGKRRQDWSIWKPVNETAQAALRRDLKKR